MDRPTPSAFVIETESVGEGKGNNERVKQMKSARSIILAIALASVFSLTAYVMGQVRGPGTTTMPTNTGQQQTMQNQTQTTRDLNSQAPRGAATAAPSASVSESPKTKGTPRGHHYGWEKGKHNPHREASVSPSPSASASASATASATSTPAATASPTG